MSLVAEHSVDEFIGKLRDTYEPYRHPEGETLNEVVFATRPSSGAFGMSEDRSNAPCLFFFLFKMLTFTNSVQILIKAWCYLHGSTNSDIEIALN